MNKLLLYFSLALLLASINTACGTIGTRVDDQIELVGSELTGVPVTVEEVNLQVARGMGEIKGFRIANPQGYVAEYAMVWELLHLNLGIFSSVAGDALVLDKLVISYPVVNLERNEQGGSNLKDLAANTEKNSAAADQKSAEEEPASEETPGEPVRIAIRELIIEGVTLNVRAKNGTMRSAILPSITLHDVGGDEGKTPGELGLLIIGTMTGEMLKHVVARELIEGAGKIQEALSVDNILEILSHKLPLTPEQLEKIRPAIERFSSALTATIDAWVSQEFIDLNELDKQLTPVLEELKVQLKTALDSEQYKEIHSVIARLEDDAVEIIRFVVVRQISTRLDMTPEQVKQLRPVLREHLVRLSNLLRESIANPDYSFEEFMISYDKFDGSLREKLAEKLNSDQIEKFAILQSEILDRIRTAYKNNF
jgi:hypothetical protein